MTYEMKDIPVLTGKAAERFMKQMELDEKRAQGEMSVDGNIPS